MKVDSMQTSNAGGGWRRELGSILQYGMFLLVVTVILLWPGEKSAAFLLALFFAVAIVTGILVWAVYRSYRTTRRREGKPPEGPRTIE
jgi:hypothetical protein